MLVIEVVTADPIDIIPIIAQENVIVILLHLVLGHEVVEPLLLGLMDVHGHLADVLALVVLRVARFERFIVVLLAPAVDELVWELLLGGVWLLEVVVRLLSLEHLRSWR